MGCAVRLESTPCGGIYKLIHGIVSHTAHVLIESPVTHLLGAFGNPALGVLNVTPTRRCNIKGNRVITVR